MTNIKGREFFSALLYIVVGVLLVVFRSDMLELALKIVGIVFAVAGILDLIRKNWISGAVSVVIGVVVVLFAAFLIDFVMLVIGILIVIKGIVSLLGACVCKSKDILAYVFPVLTVISGCVLAFADGENVVLLIGGIILIVNGALGLVESLKGAVTKK